MRHLISRNLQSLFVSKQKFYVEGVWQCNITTQIRHDERKTTKPDIFDVNKSQQKLLKVAIVGMPNAGKSTFINHLIGRNVCATSSKVHTTRSNARGIFTEGNSQVIFIDTPGLVTDRAVKRYKLANSFVTGSSSSLQHADIIGVIHDVSNESTRSKLDIKIINLLQNNVTKPSFFVFNKIDDLSQKRVLLECARLITMNCIDGKPMYAKKNKRTMLISDNCGWPHFKEVFMVSSLTGDGMDEVRKYLLNSAQPGDWEYPAEVYSDQTIPEIIIKCVKAELLNNLPQEIPYKTVPCLELYEVTKQGTVNISVVVECPTKRIESLISGEQRRRLKHITLLTQDVLQRVFKKFVKLEISLYVTPKDK